jgi:cystathionine beta-synthase
MSQIYKSVLEVIGNTPIVELQKCVPQGHHKFLGKIEYFNPGGSVKDRIALAIIEEAERSGKLKPGGTIVEATSGNTGVGLAMVAAIKGYKCIFVMPDKISEEKRAVLRAYGARVVITPSGLEPEDPRSHYSVSAKFGQIIAGAFCTNQYHNPVNAAQHHKVTGPEIWKQTNGEFDVFVAGAGTGGTISGVGRFLKEQNPKIKIVCADPFGSILKDLFYHKKVLTPPSSYFVEGIGEDMLPDNVHFDVMDDFEQVSDLESFSMCRKLASQEGLLVGPSAGAALVGAIKYSTKQKNPLRLLVLMPDSGRSYLSKAFNDAWMFEKGLLASPLQQTKVGEFLRNRQVGAELALQVSHTLKEAIHLMRENSKTHLPVFDGDRFIGVADLRDLLTALAENRLQLNEMILHIVRATVPEVSKDQTLDELQKILRQHFYARVIGSGEMISELDLAAYMQQLETTI